MTGRHWLTLVYITVVTVGMVGIAAIQREQEERITRVEERIVVNERRIINPTLAVACDLVAHFGWKPRACRDERPKRRRIEEVVDAGGSPPSGPPGGSKPPPRPKPKPAPARPQPPPPPPPGNAPAKVCEIAPVACQAPGQQKPKK